MNKRARKKTLKKLNAYFSDKETWSLDYTIAKFTVPRLKRYKEICKGHPCYLTSEEWYDILDKMIYSLEAIINEHEGFVYHIDNRTEYYEKVREGIELFGKHFNDLWW